MRDPAAGSKKKIMEELIRCGILTVCGLILFLSERAPGEWECVCEAHEEPVDKSATEGDNVLKQKKAAADGGDR